MLGPVIANYITEIKKLEWGYMMLVNSVLIGISGLLILCFLVPYPPPESQLSQPLINKSLNDSDSTEKSQTSSHKGISILEAL